MHVTTKTKEPNLVEARITVDQKELNGFVERAKKTLSEEVSVEGFRKGKAPQHLVEQKLDEKAIRSAALEQALSETFTQAVAQENWDVARTSDLKIEKNDAEELIYTIQVHLWPTVGLGDLDSVQVERKEVSVSDKDVDDALDAIRGMRSTFLDKTGAAEQGDRVEVDFKASVDGKPVEGGESKDHPLIIGGRNFMPGFEEALIGLAPGMSKEFSLQAPDDYYEPRLAGKKVDFSVTLKKVQAVLKPEADDQFAQSLGQFQSLDQLRDSLRQGIKKEKEEKERQRVRLAILDNLIQKSEISVPEDMIESELHGMIDRFSYDLQQRGLELQMYLARMKKTEQDLKKEWRPEAERQVKILLALREIARQQSITTNPDEVEGVLRETVNKAVQGGQATEGSIDLERMRTMIAEQMLRDKVLAYIEERCAKAA